MPSVVSIIAAGPSSESDGAAALRPVEDRIRRGPSSRWSDSPLVSRLPTAGDPLELGSHRHAVLRTSCASYDAGVAWDCNRQIGAERISLRRSPRTRTGRDGHAGQETRNRGVSGNIPATHARARSRRLRRPRIADKSDSVAGVRVRSSTRHDRRGRPATPAPPAGRACGRIVRRIGVVRISSSSRASCSSSPRRCWRR